MSYHVELADIDCDEDIIPSLYTKILLITTYCCEPATAASWSIKNFEGRADQTTEAAQNQTRSGLVVETKRAIHSSEFFFIVFVFYSLDIKGIMAII